MKDKRLKRLSRAELLELLLAQTQETERLQEKLKQTEALLAERDLKIRNAGDLAQAALAVNGIMEAAQQSAQLYLDNIARMEEEAKAKCAALIAEAEEEAEQIRARAGILAEEEETDEELLAELHEILDEENE